MVVTMKLTLGSILLVVFFIVHSTEAQFPGITWGQRQVGRNVFISPRQRRLSNLLMVPGIICYYAKNGRWPEYNTNLRRLVIEFSTTVFSMGDDSIRSYCKQVFQFNLLFRPRPRDIPIGSQTRTPLATTTFQSIVGQFTTFRPLSLSTTAKTNGSTSTTTTEAPTASGSGTASGTGTGTGSGRK